MLFQCSRMIYEEKLAVTTGRSEIKKQTGAKLLHFSPPTRPIIITFCTVIDSNLETLFQKVSKSIDLVLYQYHHYDHHHHRDHHHLRLPHHQWYWPCSPCGRVCCWTHCLSRGRDRENTIISLLIIILNLLPIHHHYRDILDNLPTLRPLHKE